MNSNSQNEQEQGLTLQELLLLLWDGKITIALSVAVAALMALAYLFVATPIYKVDALVQVEEKSGGAASAMFGELGSMFEMASPAEAEIEIIKSRMVLGKVVQDLHLDIVAQPKVLPVVGKALLRRDPQGANIEIGNFAIPENLVAKPFILEAQPNGSFRLYFGEAMLGNGVVGKPFQCVYQQDSIELFITSLKIVKSQKFSLVKRTQLSAIADLQGNLSAMEKGKKTGIIALSLTDPDAYKASEILNAVALAYVQQNVDRKSAEAEKTLAFLRSQLPELKLKADSAESRLNDYRLQVGSIDLNAESKMVLDQGVDLEAKLLALLQQQAEMQRLYQDDHPNLKTLRTQIARLRQEMGVVNSQVKKLPKTQQEILRLAQDAKVTAELYNTMLNNAQQLEVAKAGQVGNVRVIDIALPSFVPIKPKKASTFVLVCLLGAFFGAGIVLLRRFWSKGVEDPKLLESKFGLPVYASIPHSRAQRKVLDAMRKHVPGLKLLSSQAPDDLTVEAFRSLRTTLHFSMHDAPNNILLLVGPSPAIGKSFVSANLASILAQSGKRVCLVDADMRRGHLHESFDLQREPGLSDYLSHSAKLDVIVRKTSVENLSFVSTGMVPPNPSELLLSAQTENLLNQLSALFDMVIVDSAPLLAVADALVLAKLAGSTLIVLKYGAHREGEIEGALSRLKHAELKVKGCIFNDVRVMAGGKYGYAAKYGYAYQYGYGKGDK